MERLNIIYSKRSAASLYLLIVLFMICYLSACKKNGVAENSKWDLGSCLNDTSIYQIMTFYPDGSLACIGNVINMKREGLWTEWYLDGDIRREMKYYENNVIVEGPRPDPVLIFDNDLLPMGEKICFRAINLLPGEEIIVSDNAEITQLKDNSMYDYEVMALSGDTVDFFYPRLIKSHEDISEYLYHEYGIPQKETLEMPKEGFVGIKRKLKTLPVVQK